MVKVYVFLAGLVVAVAAAWLLIDPLAANRVWGFVNSGFGISVIILIVFGAIGGAVFLLSRNETLGAGIGILSLGAGILLVVGLGVARSWLPSNIYAEVPEAIDDAEEATVSFEPRVPWSVADASVDGSMTNINADRLHTSYLTGNNTYTTPALERGTMGFVGYEAIIQQSFDEDGDVDENTQCYFSDDANRSLGAPLGNSLERAIAREDRTVLMNRGDAWGFCDDDTAYVVLPVTKYSGNIFNRHEVPFGIAVYNGETGDVEIVEEATQDDYPGPLIGLSYAEKIENNMHYRDNGGGIGGMLSVWLYGNVGFETAGGESDDPNSNVPGNHQLRYHDAEGSAHVTPLTRVSSSTAIEYVMAVDSHEVVSGEAPNATMTLLEPARQSNAMVHHDIRSTFADINWESGIRVLELTPGPDGSWVAFIGQQTSVVYRVTIFENGDWELLDLRNGDSVLIEADVIGEEIDLDQIEDEDAVEDDESSVDIDLSDGIPDLGELSNEDLVEIGDAVLRELAGRE